MYRALYVLMLLYAGIGNASDELMQASPCPGLVSSYDVERFEHALVVTDTDFASIEDCELLGSFYFHPSRLRDYSPDYAQLEAIVDAIWQPVNEESPFLLMEALLSWMKALGLEQHAESFRDFVNEYMPAEESVQLFFTILIWLIVCGTVILVVHEFYRAGMLRLPRFHAQQGEGARAEIKPAWQWEAILALPLREQISALLQYSIEHLVNENLVPASSSFTNRELIAYLEKSDSHKAGLLREQIDLTEPVVYGDEDVSEQQLVACRRLARILHSHAIRGLSRGLCDA
jgi:hypothetical protein